MSELSKLLNQLNTNAWSSREIQRRAEKAGHRLSYVTAAKYLKGNHGMPTQDVITAFAEVFGVSPNIIRDAAGLPPLGDEPFVLGPEASRLNAQQREAIRQVVAAMLDDAPDGWATEPATPEQQNMALAADQAGGLSTGQRARAESDIRGEESQDPGEQQ